MVEGYVESLNAMIAYGALGDTAAAAKNALGGHFHLTDERMGEHQYRAFIVAPPNGRILEGVWTYDESDIIINWSVGMSVKYPHNLWHVNLPVLKKIWNREKNDK